MAKKQQKQQAEDKTTEGQAEALQAEDKASTLKKALGRKTDEDKLAEMLTFLRTQRAQWHPATAEVPYVGDPDIQRMAVERNFVAFELNGGVRMTPTGSKWLLAREGEG